MKMGKRELQALIEAHREDALGQDDSDLADARAKAMDHYHGRPYGNEKVGRSAVVSRDVMEAVDWCLPSVLRLFTQTGNVGEFDPVGPEDEGLAQQESDYVNRVIMQENNGFMVLHDALKDALILKNCYAKHWWDESTKVEEEEYSGLSMEQIVQMYQDWQQSGAEVEIINSDSMATTYGEIFAIKVRLTRKCGKVVVAALPTEEVRVSKTCRGSLQEAAFVEHVTRKTRSDLISMGMDRDFVDQLPSTDTDENDYQTSKRNTVDDETDEGGDSFSDRSMDEIEYCEAYIRVDFDGDGVAELRKVVTVGGQIPDGEQWNEPIAACAITGGVIKRVPHRHTGESMDDEIADIQEIQTSLKRQLNDNIYSVNNQQWLVNERVNLKDFLTNLPGGVKRVRGDGPIGDSVHPVMTTSIIDKIMPVIDHYNSAKEIRTGVRPGADLDPDVLQNATKGAYMAQLSRASQKMELIARLFAETFVKELFLQVHGLLIRHQDKPKQTKLRGKWVQINPQEWKTRTDLIVNVGLGTGNEEEKRSKLMMLAQLQGHLLGASGQLPPPVYAKAYALFEDVAKAMNFQTPEKYALSPNDPAYQQMMQIKQQRGNPELAKLQQEGQLAQAKMQMQAQVDKNRQEMEAQQQNARIAAEIQLAREKAQIDAQLAREKAAMDARTALEKARMDNQAKLDAAQLQANTVLSPLQEGASDEAVG